MRRVVYQKPGIALVDAPEPRLTRPDEVKVKISYCGVCGSDLHTARGDYDFREQPGSPIGHESSGVVAELGDAAAASGLRVGDRVAVYFNHYCGTCHYCRNGRENLCVNRAARQDHMSDYILANVRQVHRLPDSLDLLRASMAEPVSVCLHGIDLCRIRPGDTAAISGGGSIGLLMLQLVRLSGAARLTVVEPNPERRQMALRMGADYVIDPAAGNLSETCAQITEGLGFDTVIECSGSIKALEAAYGLTARGGTLACMAIYLGGADWGFLNAYDAFRREVRIVAGVFHSPYTIARGLELCGRLSLEPFLVALYPPERCAEAFSDAANGQCLKAVIDFNA